MKEKNVILMTYTLLVYFWIGVIGFISLSFVPDNPIYMGLMTKNSIRKYMPEGWSFFTRSPREPQLKIYQVNNGELTIHKNFPSAAKGNLYGLQKTSRSAGVEYAYLTRDIPDEYWRGCEDPLMSCLERDSLPFIEIRNTYDEQLICGEIVVVKQEIIPWAWKNKEKITMPSNYIKFRILCNNNQ